MTLTASGDDAAPGSSAAETDLAARYQHARQLAGRAREPALTSNIAYGTAGWTDPSLIRSRTFYPPSAARPEQRLRFYARHFQLVEVDASYYTILPKATAERWLGWTEPSFVFNVKAHSSLTGHPIDVSRLPAALREVVRSSGFEADRGYANQLPKAVVEQLWDGFETFIRPLAEAGRLGCILLQFPPWFTATRGNARRLQTLRERWEAYPVSVEFRHPSWLTSQRRERVFDLLRTLRCSYVVVDEPDAFGGGVSPIHRVTHPELALIRFHGHNVSGWRKGASVAERFNYLYTPEELHRWVQPTLELAREAERVHVIFNNCVRDFAVLGAKDLQVLVSDAQDDARQK